MLKFLKNYGIIVVFFIYALVTLIHIYISGLAIASNYAGITMVIIASTILGIIKVLEVLQIRKENRNFVYRHEYLEKK